MSKKPNGKDTEVVEHKDNVVELRGGNKINLTIGGDTLHDVSLDGEDVPELRKNNIDYSKYSDLTEFFVDGLVQFAKFISLGVPDEFKKDNPKHQEIHSSRNGVKAMRTCQELLTKELKKGKTGYKEPKDFKYLHEWYTDGLINFMGITMVDIPADLNDPSDDKYAVRCAIKAFDTVRKMLLDEVKELSNVKS